MIDEHSWPCHEIGKGLGDLVKEPPIFCRMLSAGKQFIPSQTSSVIDLGKADQVGLVNKPESS